MEDEKLNKSVLRIDMKTKVALHVPRVHINHLTHWKMTSQPWKMTFRPERRQDKEMNFEPRHENKSW